MQGNPIVFQSGGSTKYIMYGILILVAAVLGYIFLYKRWREQQSVAANNNIDPNTQTGKAKIIATKLRNAMKGWGTNEKLMYELADQIRTEKIPWPVVAKEYYNMYKRDLIKDVEGELDSKEIVEFWRRVNPVTITPKQHKQYAQAQAKKNTAKVVAAATKNPLLYFI